jgi:hypothetical protein
MGSLMGNKKDRSGRWRPQHSVDTAPASEVGIAILMLIAVATILYRFRQVISTAHSDQLDVRTLEF